MKTITIYYNSRPMIIHQAIADSLQIRGGYRIKSEQEFWEIHRLNCEYGLLKINKEMPAGRNGSEI